MDKEAIVLAARELQVADTADSDAVLQLMIARINELIQTDFHQLVSILYRLDVSEEKLKRLLQEQPAEDAATLIAALIVQRQAEKIKSRSEFRQDPPANEEDAW